MNTLLISYDLGGPETRRDYTRLAMYIRSFNGYAKPLESLWLVRTDKSPSVVRDELRSYLDPNDKVFVIDVTRSGWATYNISSANTDWMKLHV